ncbi:hypothetical protein SUGI_0447940 [Cryptomeria japonica]|uniref:uncharacterized protein LOC131033460 n=1 Tax=Cryptomeria japonica TaxID=3369 RepID=UPI002408C476|nr:uncharacterized protein LOC131033460 [Cryptomeria japonica]GLJ23654.1 hypothetical protein SUGI_0447940 [Cryptomeria japonica]
MALGQIGHPFNVWSHGRNYGLFPCNAHHCFAETNLNARGRCLSKTHIRGISGKGRRTGFNMTKCSSSESARAEPLESNGVVELPLFPLQLVLFPDANLSLQIYEYRYRMMMHTLLQTDLRFGVIYTDEFSGVVEVGCVAEVVKHERLLDGRFYLICKGQERFRVIKYVRTKPYLVAEVQWLEDKPSDRQEDLEKLANEVETHMKDVLRLSNRLAGKADEESYDDIRKGRFPTPFSFFVGSCFGASPREQQALLELEDTSMRLKREKETLRNSLNYLSAATAVKDVFPSSD